MAQRYIICPWCHSEMECRDQNGVEIDQCPNCDGIWLDRGELEAIVSHAGGTKSAEYEAESAEHPAAHPAVRANLFEWF